MTLNQYQYEAALTAIYPGKDTLEGLVYTILGLTGEAGECANKCKKILRDDNQELTEERRVQLAKEIGGTLWYIAMCSKELGYNLSEIAQMNIDELRSRQERGTLQGSGDNR